jgi:antitoxin VapB
VNLQIRDPRARDMAKQLARLKGSSMTEAVVDALEHRLRDVEKTRPLSALAERLRHDLAARSPGRGRDLTPDEIDALWGHGPGKDA